MIRNFIIIALAALVVVTGCTTTERHVGYGTAIGTTLGAGLGAGIGAIIGNQVGHPGAGVAIGSGMGAGIGALIGNPSVEFLETENSEADMMNGDFVWNFNVTNTPPFKSGTARVSYTDEGFAAFFGNE